MKHAKRVFLGAAALLLVLPSVAATVRPRATKEALVNPGMGWVYYHYDNSNWNYGAFTRPGDTLDWFPGASVIYFRLPWADLEPEEGKFRWDVIDTYAQSWIAAGKQVAFRFTCSESSYRYAVPKWVEDAGAKGRLYPYKGDRDHELWEPDFLDPVFLGKLGNFLAAAAAKWNGNPALAFIDVGSFGMWGEGHTGYTSKLDRQRTHEIALAHAKLYRRHFDRSYVVISDDVGKDSSRSEDNEVMKALRDLGVGFRDDSIMVDSRANHRQFFHDLWARKFAEAGLPVILEPRHYRPVAPSLDVTNWYEGGLLESTVANRASYQGIHWWPDDFLKANRKEIDEVNLRRGYRFELREASWPDEAANGAGIEIAAEWVNVGVDAPAEELCAAWTLLDDEGTVRWSCVDESFDFRKLPPTLEDGEKPVRPVSKVRFGWNWTARGNPVGSPLLIMKDGSVRTHGPNVPTVAPGAYSLAVSVGRRDGTPRIALPLDGQVGKSRRYRLGKITIR